jgi:hypothetical protein
MASTRSIRPLIGSWVAYWLVIAGVKLGPAALAIWRATRGPDGSARVDASYDNGQVLLNVTDQGVKTYTGSASLLEIGAWIAGPPLIAWAVWAISRRRKPERMA